MSFQTRSEFARARLLSERPLTFELSFDRTGRSSFKPAHTIAVQLATRHMVGDICELRDGSGAPWNLSLLEGGIALKMETYGILSEQLEIKALQERAAIELDYRLEFLQNFEAHEIGTLLVRLAETISAPIVYLAGRQGVCPLQETVQHEILVDPQARLAGWIQKSSPGKSLWMVAETGVSAVADWTRGDEKTWVGLSSQVVPGWQYAWYPSTHTAWPAPLKFKAGQVLHFKATLLNGRLFDADRRGLLVAGRTDFMTDELEFVFATSQLGTLRPYTSDQHWFNRTALAIHHIYARFYDWSWIRDNAHGYRGALLMAGSLVHSSLADEISTWLKVPLSVHGNYPHNTGLAFWEGGELWKDAWKSNLDTPAWLVSMTYDYLSQTGDWEFARLNQKDLLRTGSVMTRIIEQNPNQRPLPWIDADSDTYMDMNVIRGEQTYLAAVFYQALVQLGWILSRLSGFPAGQPFFELAAWLKTQANQSVEEGGLWDKAAGCYIGWRDPQGKIEPAGGHESYSNLVAIASGICADPARQQAILSWLDAHWDAIYTVNATPMTHSDVAYWQKEDGQRHGIPWIVGWDILARFALRSPRRFDVWYLFRRGFFTTDYAYLECAWPGYTIESLAREHTNRGRVWDSWGFLNSVWAVRLGLRPDLAHLRLQPAQLEPDGKPALACFIWQSHSYELLIAGHGDFVNSIHINGEAWPSTLLPRRNTKIEVDLGEKPFIPWLVRADPLVCIVTIAFDPSSNQLSAELSSMLKVEQQVEFALPPGWSVVSVQANGKDLPCTAGQTGFDLPFETGRVSLAVVFSQAS